jgi:uncharacterized protein YjcR
MGTEVRTTQTCCLQQNRSDRVLTPHNARTFVTSTNAEPAPQPSNILHQLPCAASLESSSHSVNSIQNADKLSHNQPREQRETGARTLTIKII